MIPRTLAIALLLSFAVHICGMSIVSIVAPEDIKRKKPYTRVDFLGPILRKTAFDMMLNGAGPTVKTTYRHGGEVSVTRSLKTVLVKREATVKKIPDYSEASMDSFVLDFLTGRKTSPEAIFGFESGTTLGEDWKGRMLAEGTTRSVLYKPNAPSVPWGLYGQSDIFTIRAKALVSPEGVVKQTEPITTTGYPALDMEGLNYLREWTFEAMEGPVQEDEWQEVEITLEAGY